MNNKTVVIREKGCVKIETVSLPPLPSDYIRVKVCRAGICGTDIELFKGTMPYLKTGKIFYPIIPGHEWAGKVDEVGSKVKNIKKDDKVAGELHLGCGFCDNCKEGKYNVCLNMQRIGIGDLPGALARYLQLPEKLVHKLPKTISYKQGSLIEPSSVALKAVNLLHFSGGERVIIFGGGPIGFMAVNACRVYGAGEIVLVIHKYDKHREEIGIKLGADRCITFKEVPKEITNTFDIAVESSGSNKVYSYLFDLVKPGGQVSLIGIAEHPVENLDLSKLVTKNVTIFGNLGSAGIWENAIRLIERKSLHPELMITHEFTLEEVVGVFKNIEKLKNNGLIKASIII